MRQAASLRRMARRTRQRSLARAREFSWERAAPLTHQVYGSAEALWTLKRVLRALCWPRNRHIRWPAAERCARLRCSNTWPASTTRSHRLPPTGRAGSRRAASRRPGSQGHRDRLAGPRRGAVARAAQRRPHGAPGPAADGPFRRIRRGRARAVEGRRYESGRSSILVRALLAGTRPGLRRTVLDLHNIESVLHARCAETEARTRARAPRFRKRLAGTGAAWLPRFTLVLAVTAADARSVAAASRPAARRGLPERPPADAAASPERRGGGGLLRQHGIPSQRSAVRFFRQEVWPRLRERWPGLVWRLVGKNPEAVRRMLLPAIRGSRSPGRWKMQWRNWRRSQGGGGAAAGRQRNPVEDPGGLGRRQCPWFPPPWVRRACRSATARTFCWRMAPPRSHANLTAIDVHRHAGKIGQSWQIVAGEGVYMGNCLEKFDF